MAKPKFIELTEDDLIPILYEDRAVMALDKPAHWMLVPFTWQKTNRNLQAALVSSIAAGHFWARSRNLRFLRHVHRLDADTTGILLFGKSPGAVDSISRLFEERWMKKTYLAVVNGVPPKSEWTCKLALSPHENEIGKVRVNAKDGKAAETHFTVLRSGNGKSLVEARPVTGRTHQIRVHLTESGFPILGDPLYGGGPAVHAAFPLALRAVSLAYEDPFTRKPVRIEAPRDEFLAAFGLGNARK
jgi:23S rRNA pseudouridine1911/1915/1917 synthase